MRSSRAAVVGTVGTVMLGAGWAAGLIGSAAAADSVSLDTFAGGASSTADSGTTGGSTGVTSATPSPTSTGSATPAPSDAATATPAPAETTPAAPSGTFDGSPVGTRYGTFQAEVVIDNGTISSVSLLQAGLNDRTSSSINNRAIPELTQRVLSAQTWNVQGVSGASYTTQGVLLSVRDALTQAGLA